MVKRIGLGITEGFVVGGLVSVLLRLRGFPWGDPVIAYSAAAVTGVGAALVGGKPPWNRGARLDGLIRALIGVFLATGSTYGARKWLPGVLAFLDASVGAGTVILMLVGAAIAVICEIDDAVGYHAMLRPDAPER